MKIPFFTILALVLFCAGFAASADDLTPPIVANPLQDVFLGTQDPASPSKVVVHLKKTFALQGVTGPVVRFLTTSGKIDVELNPTAAPNTVANFLSYVAKGDASAGGYNETLIQRAVAGFVVQGGGFYVDNGELARISAQAPVASEAGIKNTAGTIAMALSTGPDSATSDWFFNVADNTHLDDSSDGGPFTVFGRVIEAGMDTLNALLALPQVNLDSSFGEGFENVPLVNGASTSAIGPQDLIYTESIQELPLTPATEGDPALLKLKVIGNSDPGLVTPTLTGRKLTLAILHGGGESTITIQARNSAKSKVTTSFKVEVQ